MKASRRAIQERLRALEAAPGKAQLDNVHVRVSIEMKRLWQDTVAVVGRQDLSKMIVEAVNEWIERQCVEVACESCGFVRRVKVCTSPLQGHRWFSHFCTACGYERRANALAAAALKFQRRAKEARERQRKKSTPRR